MDCGTGAGANSGTGIAYSLIFTSTQVTLMNRYYDTGTNKSGCQTEDLQVSYVYDYTIGSLVNSNFNGLGPFYEFDLTLKNINVAPLTTAGTTYANASIGCTGQSFTTGSTRDVLADTGATTANCSSWVGSTSSVTSLGLGSMSVNTTTGVSSRLAAGLKTYQVVGVEEQVSRRVLYIGWTSPDTWDGQSAAKRPRALNEYAFIKR